MRSRVNVAAAVAAAVVIVASSLRNQKEQREHCRFELIKNQTLNVFVIRSTQRYGRSTKVVMREFKQLSVTAAEILYMCSLWWWWRWWRTTQTKREKECVGR